jgi:hypothetical protein
MPELIPKSIAAPASPPVPPRVPPIPPELLPLAPVPPIFQPTAWEDYPIFRETALIYVSEPEFNVALRRVGDYVFGMLLECYGDWPEWSESSTRTELRAAVADLRHLTGFLASVGQERRVSSLSPGDVKLSRYASSAARMLNRLANGLENQLAKGGQ